MERKIFQKLQKYHVLLIVSLAFFALAIILRFRNEPNTLFLVLITLVVGYLFWAFNYHRLDKSLKLEVMLEYILTALLVLIVFYGILI